MTRKKLLLAATASAVMAAFNPAFAGGGAKHGSAEDMNKSPSAATTEQTLPSTEQSASSSNDINVGAGVSVDKNSGDTERNADAKGSADADIGASAGASVDTPQGEKRSVDQDRLTGLDRAHPAN